MPYIFQSAMHTQFKHIVGKSTFKEGFALPKSVQDSISSPPKGGKRTVTILFGDGQSAEVLLRKLNNSKGNVQIRYDGRSGETFRNWLKSSFPLFGVNEKIIPNEFLVVEIINDEVLKIQTAPLNDSPCLFIDDILLHKVKEESLFSDSRFVELADSVRNIKFDESKRQNHYNTCFSKELTKRGWLDEQNVVSDDKIRLRCDYRKDDFQLEVEFGNARTYYQDILKFVMSYNAGIIRLGGLVVPNSIFSRHLCRLGRLIALDKSQGKKSSYSGMMDFTKAINEFAYIRTIFDIPFFITSIGFHSDKMKLL